MNLVGILNIRKRICIKYNEVSSFICGYASNGFVITKEVSSIIGRGLQSLKWGESRTNELLQLTVQ